ncbi:hypothetical protein [Sulfitobacter sp.]|uniref:hypothetical protein n=1 Tax=Sulfitobacter sp. TaxID=1903071 RepID=UPI003EF93AD4
MKLEDYFLGRVSQAGFEVFAVFSRFEYAMKKGGFRRERYPDAAWPTFANALPEGFFEKMKVAAEASIYFEEPPDHLVTTENGGVAWSEAPQVPTDAATLFESIKTARNNLFHGDKKHNRERDTNLMVAALFVLNEAYKAAEEDDQFFDFIGAMEFGL